MSETAILPPFFSFARWFRWPTSNEVVIPTSEPNPIADEPKQEDANLEVEEPKQEQVEAVCPKVEDVCPKVEAVCPKVETVSPKVEKSKHENLKELKIDTKIDTKINTKIVMNEPEPKDQNKVVEETLNEVISTIETKPEPHIPIDHNEFAQPKQKKIKVLLKK